MATECSWGHSVLQTLISSFISLTCELSDERYMVILNGGL